MIELSTESLGPTLGELSADGLLAFSLSCAERCRNAWTSADRARDWGALQVDRAELDETIDRMWAHGDGTTPLRHEAGESWQARYRRCAAMLPNYDAGAIATLDVRMFEDGVTALANAIRCLINADADAAIGAASSARSCVYEWYTRELPDTVWGPLQFEEDNVNVVTTEICAQARDVIELAAGPIAWQEWRRRARKEAHQFV